MYGLGIVMIVLGLMYSAEMFLWNGMSEGEKLYCAIESADFKTQHSTFITGLCIVMLVFGISLLVYEFIKAKR